MKDNTILIIGGLGIGAYILYKSGILQTVSSVGNVATTGANAVSSDIANVNAGLSADLSSFNKGLNEEIKNIGDIFSNITGTISGLTNNLKNLASPSTSSSSPSSAVSNGGGGGTIPISQSIGATPTTGGYVVTTPQGGVSYASGTGPLSGKTNPLTQKNTATSFFG